MLFPSLFGHFRWNRGSDRQALRPSGQKAPRRVCHRASALLYLEALEERSLPSTLVVTSAADDGSAGTLRAVLARAQSGDSIRFAHKLDGQTITLVQGPLSVTENISIHGPGAGELTISGNAASRILEVGSGTAVRISGLTLTQGLATDGAAILNAGNLTVGDDVFSGNVAQGIAAGGLFGDEGGRGGAIENQAGAALEVEGCVFDSNQAVGGPDGGVAFGGGIYNEAGTIVIAGSTFTGNLALAALLSQRGLPGTPATLPGGFSITLTDVAGGGAVWNDGGSLSLGSSSLSNNQAEGASSENFGSTFNTFIGSALGGAVGSGAFFSSATPSLEITGSSLSGNLALAAATSYSFFGTPFYFPAGISRGGAVEAFAGNVSVSSSALSGNLAESGTALEKGAKSFGAGLGAAGGGIDDELNLRDFAAPQPATLPALNVQDSTISGNTALNNAPAKGNVLNVTAAGGGLDTSFVNAQVSRSKVTGNQALGSPGTNGSYYISGGYTADGGYATGGGIDSFAGSLTITGSSVKDNLVQGGSGAAQTGGFGGGLVGGNANGGGIASNSQSLALNNSTVSGNQAVGGSDTGYESRRILTGSSYGGGLCMGFDAPSYGGSATIGDTTFANNLAQGGATFNGFSGLIPFTPGASVGGGVDAFLTSLQMSDCRFTLNRAQGGAGEGGAFGGPGVGGGFYCLTTSFTIDHTDFSGNVAQGGVGSRNDSTLPGLGVGGTSWGGAFVSQSGTSTLSTLSDCRFVHNASQGGAGGGGLPGNGGSAEGGAVLLVDAGATSLSNCTFVGNLARGGSGGDGAAGNAGGNGGAASGGALVNLSDGPPTTTTLSDCLFVHNTAQGGGGGSGGAGAAGGNGGNARGGAVYNQASLTITTCALLANQAEGGDGTQGGNGGNGYGGGLFIDTGATATVQNSLIIGNEAEGGAAPDGGSPGQGVGGGVYNLGTFNLDAASLIIGNRASTSNDNVFGPVTPI